MARCLNMKFSEMLLLCAGNALLCPTPWLWGKTLNVVDDYGADHTGATYATASIQNAIDACQPGDTLPIPPGTFLLNNGLKLKSDLTVMLSSNALLQANTKGVWENNRSPVFLGRGLNHVTITGGGGLTAAGWPCARSKGTEPGNGLRFRECTNVTIRDIAVCNMPTFRGEF